MSRIPGSFRDPEGFVFEHEGRIFRALSAKAAGILEPLEKDGHFRRWADAHLVVESSFVPPGPLFDELSAIHPGYPAFLAHERIPLISYPCEWSTTMLADAAALTLRLQGELLDLGLSLKDASAYNVQFVRGRPVFIDLTSIEKPERLDAWQVMGQFNRMFLYPLLLAKHAGWDLHSYFLANLDGRSTLQVGQAFSAAKRFSPSLLLDVGIPYAIEKRVKHAPAKAKPLAMPTGGAEIQHVTLRRLASKIEKLAASLRPETVWGDYTKTCSYDDEAERSKKAIVGDFLRRTAPGTVLDLGCNTGDYSLLAAEAGASALATDFDVSAIDQLYRRLKASPNRVTPLVVDIANPSPGMGFMNRERAPFLERAQSDCVLALALIHHLLIGANLSLSLVRDLFASLANKHLILEFVPPSDPMFQKLVEFRENLYPDLSLQSCLDAFTPAFKALEIRSVEHSPRSLILFQRQ